MLAQLAEPFVAASRREEALREPHGAKGKRHEPIDDAVEGQGQLEGPPPRSTTAVRDSPSSKCANALR